MKVNAHPGVASGQWKSSVSVQVASRPLADMKQSALRNSKSASANASGDVRESFGVVARSSDVRVLAWPKL